MPTREQIEGLNAPYFLFYRFFLGLAAAIKIIEKSVNDSLVLDRMLQGTIPISTLSFQQDQLCAAIYEFISFGVTRSEKAMSDMISKRIYGKGSKKGNSTTSEQLLNTSRSQRSLLGGSLKNPAELPPQLDEMKESCEKNSAVGEKCVNNQENISDSASSVLCRSEERVGELGVSSCIPEIVESSPQLPNFASQLKKIYVPDLPKHKKSCPFSRNDEQEKQGHCIDDSFCDSIIAFTSPKKFVTMEYAENPEGLMKACPVCGGQAFVQSIWVTLCLLQHLNTLALAHLAVVPLSIPSEFHSPSPYKVTVHVYHMAQRFFETGIHGALAVFRGVPLDCRLSFPLTFVSSVVREIRVKRGKASKTSSSFHQGNNCGSVSAKCGSEDHNASLSDSRGRSRSFQGQLEACLPAPPSLNDNYYYTKESHEAQQNVTVAAAIQDVFSISLGLLEGLPKLTPALTVAFNDYSLQDNDSSEIDREVRRAVCDACFSGYSLHDVLLVMRSYLLQSLIWCFTDGAGGALKAQNKLVELCQDLVSWEQEQLPPPHVKPKLHSSKNKKNLSHKVDHVFFIAQTKWGNTLELIASWPWNHMKQIPFRSTLVNCEKDLFFEYLELKQVILLLAIFTDLVEDKDCKEELSVLQAATAGTNGGSFEADLSLCKLSYIASGAGKELHDSKKDIIRDEKLLEAVEEKYLQKKQKHYDRLGVGKMLLDAQVKPVLQELSNSSNGSSAARGRQLLALMWLLKAEIIRFREEITSPSGTGGDEDMLKQIKEAEACALAQTDTAKDFIGMSMQYFTNDEKPPSQPFTSKPRSSMQIGELIDEPSTLSWRSVLPCFKGKDNAESFGEYNAKSTSNHIQKEGSIQYLGVIPPGWIRMWLTLCREVFRSPATDLVFLTDENESPEDNTTCVRSTSSLPPISASKGVKGSKGEAKKTLLKQSANEKTVVTTKKRKGKETESIENRHRIARWVKWSLMFSKQPICFWHRWSQLFGVEPDLASNCSSPTQQDGRSVAPPSEGASRETHLSVMALSSKLSTKMSRLFTLKQPGDIGALPASVLTRQLVSALQEVNPLFQSGDAAFASVVDFTGLGEVRPHPSSRVQSSETASQSLSLFPSPSVTACIPNVAESIRSYWGRLGFPPFFSEA